MDDIRIQEIINESINNLLISEGLFGNKELNYLKQTVDDLNGTLSSLSKGVSMNQIVFKPNPDGSINGLDGQPQEPQQGQDQNGYDQQEDEDDYGYDQNQEQGVDTDNYPIYDGDEYDRTGENVEINGNTVTWNMPQRRTESRKRKQRLIEQQPQQQGQQQPQQPQLTPQQQQIQSNVPEVVRCWNWGKQVISTTISLLKRYLALNGIKENRLYEDANGTMVNPMQIFRGGYQSGKNGYLRGYRQGKNLINKFKSWGEKYNSMKRGLKTKEQLIQQLRENIQDYRDFCQAVDDCQQQIATVAANVVFGKEILQDIVKMTSPQIKQIYDNLENMKFLKQK